MRYTRDMQGVHACGLLLYLFFFVLLIAPPPLHLVISLSPTPLSFIISRCPSSLAQLSPLCLVHLPCRTEVRVKGQLPGRTTEPLVEGLVMYLSSLPYPCFISPDNTFSTGDGLTFTCTNPLPARPSVCMSLLPARTNVCICVRLSASSWALTAP